MSLVDCFNPAGGCLQMALVLPRPIGFGASTSLNNDFTVQGTFEVKQSTSNHLADLSARMYHLL